MKDYFILDITNVHGKLNNFYYYNFDRLTMEDRQDLSEVMQVLKKYINRQDEDFDDFIEE